MLEPFFNIVRNLHEINWNKLSSLILNKLNVKRLNYKNINWKKRTKNNIVWIHNELSHGLPSNFESFNFLKFNFNCCSNTIWLRIVITSYMPRAMPRVNYFLHFKNNQDLKVLSFFTKLYPKVLGLVATPDPRVIFIILIITLNLG